MTVPLGWLSWIRSRVPGIQPSSSCANRAITWRNRSRSVSQSCKKPIPNVCPLTHCTVAPSIMSDQSRPGTWIRSSTDKKGDTVVKNPALPSGASWQIFVMDSTRQPPEGQIQNRPVSLERGETRKRSPKLHAKARRSASVAWRRGHCHLLSGSRKWWCLFARRCRRRMAQPIVLPHLISGQPVFLC